jgi:hypothetical protein
MTGAQPDSFLQILESKVGDSKGLDLHDVARTYVKNIEEI